MSANFPQIFFAAFSHDRKYIGSISHDKMLKVRISCRVDNHTSTFFNNKRFLKMKLTFLLYKFVCIFHLNASFVFNNSILVCIVGFGNSLILFSFFLLVDRLIVLCVGDKRTGVRTYVAVFSRCFNLEAVLC